MSDYLPVEVIVEILRRLPAKSVVKCRSVCKTWNILITSPSFISTHLQTSMSKPHSHLFLLHKWFENEKQTFSLHFDNDEFDEFKQLPLPVAVINRRVPYFQVLGSCHGLVCLYCAPNMLIFWNPSIQKYITLPPNPFITKYFCATYGFGFDPRTNDYKLLELVFEQGETSIKACLFSLNENSWKRLTSISPKYASQIPISSTYVNGTMHWLGYHDGKDGEFSNLILSFDINNEEFFVIRLPESLIGLSPMYLLIMNYEESSIAVLRGNMWVDDGVIDLWVMRKYGVVESWTRVLHLTDQNGSLPEVLGFRKNGGGLLGVYDGNMVSLDLNCQQMKHLGIEAEEGNSSVDSYVESLVLLEKGVDAGVASYENHSNDSSGLMHHGKSKTT